MKFKTLSVVSSLAVVASLTTPAYAQDDTTGTVDEFRALGERFLQLPLAEVEQVAIRDLELAAA